MTGNREGYLCFQMKLIILVVFHRMSCQRKRQQKHWGGGRIVSDSDMQIYNINTNNLQVKWLPCPEDFWVCSLWQLLPCGDVKMYLNYWKGTCGGFFSSVSPQVLQNPLAWAFQVQKRLPQLQLLPVLCLSVLEGVGRAHCWTLPLQICPETPEAWRAEATRQQHRGGSSSCTSDRLKNRFHLHRGAGNVASRESRASTQHEQEPGLAWGCREECKSWGPGLVWAGRCCWRTRGSCPQSSPTAQEGSTEPLHGAASLAARSRTGLWFLHLLRLWGEKASSLRQLACLGSAHRQISLCSFMHSCQEAGSALAPLWHLTMSEKVWAAWAPPLKQQASHHLSSQFVIRWTRKRWQSDFCCCCQS